MINQIELDACRNGGLPWSDSQDSTVALPPTDAPMDGVLYAGHGLSPTAALHPLGAAVSLRPGPPEPLAAPPMAHAGSVLPDARPDPRIRTQAGPRAEEKKRAKSVLELHKAGQTRRSSLNPLAAVVAERLEENARQTQAMASGGLFGAHAEQDPRVQTQPIQPTVVAGQDYRCGVRCVLVCGRSDWALPM
jgi:hypothetical protein